MKKIISLAIVATMLLCSIAAFTSCNKDVELVAIPASDLIQEDFGVAVKKGNTELLDMINAVIKDWLDSGKMDKYIDYYDAISKGEDADKGDLTTEWDFGDATETLTLYTESGFAPYEFISEGKVIGVDVALMSEVAVRNNMKIDIKDVAFDTITTCVKSAEGHAVGAAGMSITDERKEDVDFSDVYASSTIVIVSASGKAYDSVADLSGLKVGVQEGTVADIIISDAAKEGKGYQVDDDHLLTISSKTEIKQYKQYALALQDLKAGRIDCILMDKLPAEAMIAASENNK